MKKQYFLKKTVYNTKHINNANNPPYSLDNVFYFFASNNAKITKRQIEKFILVLKFISRIQKKEYKKKIRYFIYLNPLWFTTKKALGVRMGKGKGGKSMSFCRVNKGFLFLKVFNVNSYNSFFFLNRIFSFFQFKVNYFFSLNKKKEEFFFKKKTKKFEIK